MLVTRWVKRDGSWVGVLGYKSCPEFVRIREQAEYMHESNNAAQLGNDDSSDEDYTDQDEYDHLRNQDDDFWVSWELDSSQNLVPVKRQAPGAAVPHLLPTELVLVLLDTICSEYTLPTSLLGRETPLADVRVWLRRHHLDDLRNMSMVCRAWHAVCNPLRFSVVFVDTQAQSRNHRLLRNFCYETRQHVRTIVVVGPRSWPVGIESLTYFPNISQVFLGDQGEHDDLGDSGVYSVSLM